MGQTPFDQLPLKHLMGEDADRIEKQYERIFLPPRKTEEIFCDELQLPKDSTVFWGKVMQFRDSSDDRPYRELSMYALDCLLTPTSNAVIECIFSQVTAVKSKYRNRLSMKMLDASYPQDSCSHAYQGCMLQ